MPGNGNLTAAVKPGEQAAFGLHADAGGTVLHEGHHFSEILAILTEFDAERALPHGGDERGRGKRALLGH